MEIHPWPPLCVLYGSDPLTRCVGAAPVGSPSDWICWLPYHFLLIQHLVCYQVRVSNLLSKLHSQRAAPCKTRNQSIRIVLPDPSFPDSERVNLTLFYSICNKVFHRYIIIDIHVLLSCWYCDRILFLFIIAWNPSVWTWFLYDFYTHQQRMSSLIHT